MSKNIFFFLEVLKVKLNKKNKRILNRNCLSKALIKKRLNKYDKLESEITAVLKGAFPLEYHFHFFGNFFSKKPR